MPDDSYTPEEARARRAIHEAIQDNGSVAHEVECGVLVGWVVAAEWMDEEGQRWLTSFSGADGGEDSPPIWQVFGYLHHSLFNTQRKND